MHSQSRVLTYYGSNLIIHSSYRPVTRHHHSYWFECYAGAMTFPVPVRAISCLVLLRAHLFVHLIEASSGAHVATHIEQGKDGQVVLLAIQMSGPQRQRWDPLLDAQRVERVSCTGMFLVQGHVEAYNNREVPVLSLPVPGLPTNSFPQRCTTCISPTALSTECLLSQLTHYHV